MVHATGLRRLEYYKDTIMEEQRITHPRLEIGCNSAEWICNDGFVIRTTTAPFGTIIPYSGGVYVFCKHTGSTLEPLLVGSNSNMGGRLNETMAYFPYLLPLVEMGADFICFHLNENACERREIEELFIKNFDPFLNRNIMRFRQRG